MPDAFSGTQLSEAEDARELVEWARKEVGLEIPEAELTGVTQETARQILWNAFDERYRPEMRGMERSLILHQLDSTWKNHLYTMDHLRGKCWRFTSPRPTAATIARKRPGRASA